MKNLYSSDLIMIETVLKDYENIYNFILEKIKEYYDKPQFTDGDRVKCYFKEDKCYNSMIYLDASEINIELKISKSSFNNEDCSRLSLYIDQVNTLFSSLLRNSFIMKLNGCYVIAEPTEGIIMISDIDVNEEELIKRGMEINDYIIDFQTENTDITDIVKFYLATHDFMVKKLRKKIAFVSTPSRSPLNQYTESYKKIRLFNYHNGENCTDLSTKTNAIIKNEDGLLINYELENSVFTKIPFSDENVYVLCNVEGFHIFENLKINFVLKQIIVNESI